MGNHALRKRRFAESYATKRERIECRLYEIAGVRVFRAFVFRLEKLIHRRDKGQNVNYHIDDYGSKAPTDFKKYLALNAAIHIRNAVFLSAVLVLCMLLPSKYTAAAYGAALLLVKDLYCIMLQRYNFLRIAAAERRIAARRENVIRGRADRVCAYCAENNVVFENSAAEEIVEKLLHAVENGENIFVCDEDAEALYLLGKVLMESQIKKDGGSQYGN